jgi:hypothetical protein
MSRLEPREQVTAALARFLKNRIEGLPAIMRNDPLLSPGEYLGDIEADQVESLFNPMRNINDEVNSFRKVDQANSGEWLVFADFDYNGDGKFLGLRLVPKTPMKRRIT